MFGVGNAAGRSYVQGDSLSDEQAARARCPCGGRGELMVAAKNQLCLLNFRSLPETVRSPPLHKVLLSCLLTTVSRAVESPHLPLGWF